MKKRKFFSAHGGWILALLMVCVVALAADNRDQFATDEDASGVHYPKHKLVFGANDTFTNVTSSDPLPVTAVSGASDSDHAEDAAHVSGEQGKLILGVRNDTLATLVDTDGDRAPFQINASGAVYTEVSAALPTGANVIGGVTQSGEPWDIGGDVAHDGADSGNPLKIGYKAIAHGANPTAVAANDRTDGYANRHGIPWQIGGHPNSITKSVLVTDVDGAQTDAAIVTVGAGNVIVVTRVTVQTDGDNTANVDCRVGFGAVSVPTPALAGTEDILIDARGIKAGGGVTSGDGSGILGTGSDGSDLRFTCEDPTGGNLTITVTYYTVES